MILPQSNTHSSEIEAPKEVPLIGSKDALSLARLKDEVPRHLQVRPLPHQRRSVHAYHLATTFTSAPVSSPTRHHRCSYSLVTQTSPLERKNVSSSTWSLSSSPCWTCVIQKTDTRCAWHAAANIGLSLERESTRAQSRKASTGCCRSSNLLTAISLANTLNAGTAISKC
jgi:hypothetical protein